MLSNEPAGTFYLIKLYLDRRIPAPISEEWRFRAKSWIRQNLDELVHRRVEDRRPMILRRRAISQFEGACGSRVSKKLAFLKCPCVVARDAVVPSRYPPLMPRCYCLPARNQVYSFLTLAGRTRWCDILLGRRNAHYNFTHWLVQKGHCRGVDAEGGTSVLFRITTSTWPGNNSMLATVTKEVYRMHKD